MSNTLSKYFTLCGTRAAQFQLTDVFFPQRVLMETQLQRFLTLLSGFIGNSKEWKRVGRPLMRMGPESMIGLVWSKLWSSSLFCCFSCPVSPTTRRIEGRKKEGNKSRISSRGCDVNWVGFLASFSSSFQIHVLLTVVLFCQGTLFAWELTGNLTVVFIPQTKHHTTYISYHSKLLLMTIGTDILVFIYYDIR